MSTLGVIVRGSVLALLAAAAAGWQSAPVTASFDSNGVSIRYPDQGNGDAYSCSMVLVAPRSSGLPRSSPVCFREASATHN